jgi:hypothetical protein
MKYLNKKYILIVIIIVLIIRYITFFVFPSLSGDGPWALSSTYSYIIGIKDSSVFAHHYLGNVFTVHFIDFVFSSWFKLFSLGTYSFISLEFFIIVLTLLVWGFIAKNAINKFFIHLLMLGYVLSPYVYGFRPEGFTILIISILILLTKLDFNSNIKIITISILCIISGLAHHIGGLIAVIIAIFYFLFVAKVKSQIIKFCVSGFFLHFYLQMVKF